MKLIWRCITTSTCAGIFFALSGCAQVNTARQWWQVWNNPVSTSSPIALSSSKVIIDLQKIAKHHPAWKLAEQLETSPPTALRLNWTHPKTITGNTINPPRSSSGFANSILQSIDFSESAQMISASEMEALNAQMTQQQQAVWDEWEQDIDENLEADRKQITQAMQVDLDDQIKQSQKNIPEAMMPLTPSTEIQNEMINLHLKLLNNITLSPDDKAAAEKRLNQLEAQWTEQLRQQAQQGADRQQYWRETVPQQLRKAGKVTIQNVLNALEQTDRKAIDLTINSQLNFLSQDNMRDKVLSLTLPQIAEQAAQTKSTFNAPVLSEKLIASTFSPITIPATVTTNRTSTQRAEIYQLKKIALEAAKKTAAQSAVKHNWQWAQNQQNTSVKDVTEVVLKEANFK